VYNKQNYCVFKAKVVCIFVAKLLCIFVAKLLCILAKQCVGKGVPYKTMAASETQKNLGRRSRDCKTLLSQYSFEMDFSMRPLACSQYF